MTTLANPGKLQPWTRAIAERLAAMFGLRTIGGWRADGGGFEDHPEGRALDLMVDDIPNGKAVGDAIVAELTAHPDVYDVDYIIWYGRSWNPRRGTWVPYTDTDDPHTNHVHLSTLKTPPKTGLIPTALTSAGSAALGGALNVDRLLKQAEGTTITVAGAVFGVALLAAGVVLTVKPRKGPT